MRNFTAFAIGHKDNWTGCPPTLNERPRMNLVPQVSRPLPCRAEESSQDIRDFPRIEPSEAYLLKDCLVLDSWLFLRAATALLRSPHELAASGAGQQHALRLHQRKTSAKLSAFPTPALRPTYQPQSSLRDCFF